MSERKPRLWQVVRQDENGHRYRIGHCASQADAQRLLRRLERQGQFRSPERVRYAVERVE